MKFYAVVYGDWHGIGDEDVVDVFYNEEDAEQDVERRDPEPDEWYEVREWDEEKVRKFWGDCPIS